MKVDPKYFDVQKGPMCFKYKEWGHKASDCTAKVYSVKREDRAITEDTQCNVITGKVGTMDAEIVLDSGADVSIVCQDLVPSGAYTGETMCIAGVLAIPRQVPVARVFVKVQDRRFWV